MNATTAKKIVQLPGCALAPVQNPPRRGRLPKSIPTLIRAKGQKVRKQQALALREVEVRLEIALSDIRLYHSRFLPKLEADVARYRAEIARLTGRAPMRAAGEAK